MSLVCSAPLLGCVSCFLCCSTGPGTQGPGPGRGGSSVSLTAQITALQPLLCHQCILRFSMSFSFTTGVLLSPAVHSEPCGPWLCRKLGAWHAATTQILSLLKSRVQMPSPYPVEGWRGLFYLTPEWECLVVPHLPSSGRLGARAPQAWPGAPVKGECPLGVSKVSWAAAQGCRRVFTCHRHWPALEALGWKTGMVTVTWVCLSWCCGAAFQQCETLSPDI